jgi:hypothetical protein
MRLMVRLMGLEPTTFCMARAQIAGRPWPVTAHVCSGFGIAEGWQAV